MVTKYFSPSPSLTSFPVKPFFCFTGPRAINMPVGAKHQRLFSQPSGAAISLTGAHLSTHARARSYPAKHSARLALASGYACLSLPKFVAPLQGNHELHLLILRSFRFSCFHCPFSHCDSCTLPHSIVKARGGFRNENKGTRVCVEAHRRGALTGTGRTRLPSSDVFILIVLFLSIQRLLYEFEIIFIVRRKWVSMKGGNRERNSGEYVEF